MSLQKTLTRSTVFNADDTALCFVLCIVFQCRLFGNLGNMPVRQLYEKFVPATANLYGKLNQLARIAGCANWGALVTPYLYFDVESMVMTLYKDDKRAEPQHRISITGQPRPELNGGHINHALPEDGRVVSMFVLPRDRSKACELAIRKVVRLFGDLQLQFKDHLQEALEHNETIPAPLDNILTDMRTTLLQVFPPPDIERIIPPPGGRVAMTPMPRPFGGFLAEKLSLPVDGFTGSPDKWTPKHRRGFLHIPLSELIEADFRLHGLFHRDPDCYPTIRFQFG